jgi:hypothetical protein
LDHRNALARFRQPLLRGLATAFLVHHHNTSGGEDDKRDSADD